MRIHGMEFELLDYKPPFDSYVIAGRYNAIDITLRPQFIHFDADWF